MIFVCRLNMGNVGMYGFMCVFYYFICMAIIHINQKLRVVIFKSIDFDWTYIGNLDTQEVMYVTNIYAALLPYGRTPTKQHNLGVII